jgi:pre-rRNA-processing protein IPI1
MILKNDDLIKLEFNNLLENVCPLFTDRCYKTREAAIQLLKTLISLPYFNNKSVLQPFYGLINVHLSCAMTHIVEEVQHSSLKLLDILIESLPDLVKTHAYNIFENFIDQISKANLKGERTLKNDPFKFTSTQAWRHNVLNHLYKMLLIVAENKNGKRIDSEFIELNGDESSKISTFFIEFDESRKCLINIDTNRVDNRTTLKIW